MLIVSSLEHSVMSYLDLAPSGRGVAIVDLLVGRGGAKPPCKGDDILVLVVQLPV